ncbi:hypothetical protein Pmani_019800 [Petrolisthes manimaculis]|uniref:Uncharacterized protein n=1 Tax=Petrolisthes manimaculis TaxID=1843537 RepID=A0AAE1PK01_9EUCA|nr:hypothetical protein Pmani_019800 [Petrolisthes manimaculis]
MPKYIGHHSAETLGHDVWCGIEISTPVFCVLRRTVSLVCPRFDKNRLVLFIVCSPVRPVCLAGWLVGSRRSVLVVAAVVYPRNRNILHST